MNLQMGIILYRELTLPMLLFHCFFMNFINAYMFLSFCNALGDTIVSRDSS